MIYSKELMPNGKCYFCNILIARKEAKFCSLSCNAKYGGKYKTLLRIEAYKASPKECLSCGTAMLLKEGQKVYDMLRNKFCDKKCAAKYNNLIRNPNVARYLCKECGKISKKWYCDKECRDNFYTRLGRPPKPKRRYLAEKTKGEVFAKAKNYASARSSIQKNARSVFKASKSLSSCIYCEYAVGIDVCHIKDVCDFSDTALISVINSPENMIALCKRHHYEFDKHFLKLEDIISGPS